MAVTSFPIETKTLAELTPSTTTLGDNDLMHLDQGGIDKHLTGSVLKQEIIRLSGENQLPPKGLVFGGELSKTAANSLTIQPFSCLGKNSQTITLASSLVKDVDSSLIDGTGGGAKTGMTIAADDTIHVYAMLKDDGSVNVGFDNVDATATSLLAAETDYVDAQYLGSVLYETSNIKGFSQGGNFFQLDTPVQEAAFSVSTTPVTHISLAPKRISPVGLYHFSITSSYTGQFSVSLQSTLNTAYGPTRVTVFDLDHTADTREYGVIKRLLLDSTSAVRVVSQDTQSGIIYLQLQGWEDNKIGKL